MNQRKYDTDAWCYGENEQLKDCPLCRKSIESGEHISIIDGIMYHKNCYDSQRRKGKK